MASETEHGFAGRVAAANTPSMVTFCLCGLGFFGRDTNHADMRFQEHERALGVHPKDKPGWGGLSG